MVRKVGRRASMLAILTTLALVLTTAPAFAKGPPTSESTNNLSVPAIFVPSTGVFTALSCPSEATTPTGTTAVYDGVTYYIQGQATWQAECTTALAGTLSVNAAWGDNLTGAPLKAGTPIRVEMGLIHTLPTGTTMTGYQVLNLTNVLDRTDTYGTTGTPVEFSEVRAYDAGATLSIYNKTTQSWVLQAATASAEINATGAVVYGYNWGSGKGSKSTLTAGDYTITFYAPNVSFAGTDAGTISADGHTVTLDVTVNAKTSGQGGGSGHRG